MDSNQKTAVIFIIFLAVLFVVNQYGGKFTEGFAPCEETKFTPYMDHISMTPDPSTSDVNQYKVDQLPCHPSCCGQPTPVPFDGLTSNEVKQTLKDSNSNKGGKFIENSYRCSIGATGCPCMPKDVFGFEASRGFNNGTQKPWIDPTWMLNAVEVEGSQDYYSNYQKLDASRSYYDSGRLLNDNEPRVSMTNVNDVDGVSK